MLDIGLDDDYSDPLYMPAGTSLDLLGPQQDGDALGKFSCYYYMNGHDIYDPFPNDENYISGLPDVFDATLPNDLNDLASVNFAPQLNMEYVPPTSPQRHESLGSLFGEIPTISPSIRTRGDSIPVFNTLPCPEITIFNEFEASNEILQGAMEAQVFPNTVPFPDPQIPRYSGATTSCQVAPRNNHKQSLENAQTKRQKSHNTRSKKQTPYRNPILDCFDNPDIPLRVIDELCFSFYNDILEALTGQLTPRDPPDLAQRDQDFEHGGSPEVQEHSDDYPNVGWQSGLVLPPPLPTPEPSSTSTPAPKTNKNNRTNNIVSRRFDANSAYKPLPHPPSSWSAKDSRTKANVTFEYTSYGELTPGKHYSQTELLNYLAMHPLHKFVNGLRDYKNSQLILWVQSVPADSKGRYPTKSSSKCRFADCSAENNSIRNGHFRVAFDEQRQDNMDPYHCAGYVHLYCLEKHFNFPQFCNTFNVRSDDRKFPGEPNRMALTRDLRSLKEMFRDFCDSAPDSGRYEDSNAWFKKTLTYLLTDAHIKRQSQHIKDTREERGGLHRGTHMGNLDTLAKLKLRRDEEKDSGVIGRSRQKKEYTSAPERRVKRKKEVITIEDSDESGLDDDILERNLAAAMGLTQKAAGPPQKKHRRI